MKRYDPKLHVFTNTYNNWSHVNVPRAFPPDLVKSEGSLLIVL